jgi:hypothetical protein
VTKKEREIKKLWESAEKLLATLPVEPPMGFAGAMELIANAQREGRSAEYYNSDGKFKLWIGRRPKRLQPRCGAKTRAGTPCKMRAVEGKKRCRLHGGLSTGPKTAAGRARIAESNRRRAGRKKPQSGRVADSS